VAVGGRVGSPGGVPRTRGIPVVGSFSESEILTQPTASAIASITEADDALVSTSTVLVSPSVSVTEGNDTLAATETTATSLSASIIEAADTVSATSAVLVSPSASLAEATDTVAAVATVLISLSATITEGDDQLAATALSGAEVVVSMGGSGGYIRRVKPKPAVEPKPLDRRTARLAIREQDDVVDAVATVEGQSLAAAALALAEAQAAERKRRVIDHNNNFLMAA
jgi:hypothetical protein